LYTFSFFEKSQIIPIADSIREEFIDLIMSDQTFVQYITSSTDKAERIQYRADVWRQRLQSLVADKQPRGFTLELKEKLYEANPTCEICKQRIRDVDDSEVDHIEHYWRGGKTIPENARLTHRYCNRARGGRQ
jgi:5-methylcytosine-specific restriction endonuclease McrA